MVRNLSHLHDKPKDVGVVVQKNTLGHISVKLALSIGHDAVGEIIFRLTKELAVDVYLLYRKVHGIGVVFFYPTQHQAARQQAQLAKPLPALARVSSSLDGTQNFVVEDADVLDEVVLAVRAFGILVLLARLSLTRALLAEIRGEGLNIQKPQQGEELADSVLQWGPRQAPGVSPLERVAGPCCLSCWCLDAMRLIQNHPMKVGRMDDRLLHVHAILPGKALLLLLVHGRQSIV